MLAFQYRALNFTISDLRYPYSYLPLVKGEEAKIEAPA